MNRRKFISGVGIFGVTTIAGCGEADSEPVPEPEPEQESDEEGSESEGEAIFEFNEISPVGDTYTTDEEIAVTAEVENIGDAVGEQTIEFRSQGETIDEGQFELEPGEVENLGIRYNPNTFEPGEYSISFVSEDDEISGSLIVEDPEMEEPATQSFSGTGQSVEDGIEIEGGLTVVEASHDGESNFQVSLVDDSEFDANFINETDDFNGAQADLIDSGEYILNVHADGSWDIDIHQPRSATGNSLPESISGNGPDVVGPIQFTGTHVVRGSHAGERNFQVRVYPMKVDLVKDYLTKLGSLTGKPPSHLTVLGG